MEGKIFGLPLGLILLVCTLLFPMVFFDLLILRSLSSVHQNLEAQSNLCSLISESKEQSVLPTPEESITPTTTGKAIKKSATPGGSLE